MRFALIAIVLASLGQIRVWKPKEATVDMANTVDLTLAVSLHGTVQETYDYAPPNTVNIRQVIAQTLTSGTGDNQTSAPYIDYLEGASPITLDFGNDSLLDVHNQAITWATVRFLMIENVGTTLVRLDGSIMDSFSNLTTSDWLLPPPPTGGKSFIVLNCGQDFGGGGWQMGGTTLQFISSGTIKVNVWLAP